MQSIDTIIFDLGAVLIDWNPRYLYRKILKDEAEIDWFFQNVCTPEWNDQQDAGRSFEEATDELIAKHPAWEEAIRAWYDRWEETITGPVHGTVEILREIKDANRFKLYALTNWSAQTFPWALRTFPFLQWFDGIVVSGQEKTRKPFPEFYQILFDRYHVKPQRALFIDDNEKNVIGAHAVRLQTVHFTSAEQLRSSLIKLHIL